MMLHTMFTHAAFADVQDAAARRRMLLFVAACRRCFAIDFSFFLLPPLPCCLRCHAAIITLSLFRCRYAFAAAYAAFRGLISLLPCYATLRCLISPVLI